MMIHGVSMVALFVDQLTQPPVVVQCAQAISDPWWKWWVQTVIPVAGGTMIAVWSFVQNRQSEQEQWKRNQKAAHEQWLLYQKKAEWKELIKTASEIESVIPVTLRIQEGYDSVSMFLPQRIAQLLGIRASCLFLGDILYRKENLDAFSEFISVAAVVAEILQGFNSQTETDPGVRQLCRTKYAEIRDAYLKFCSHLRTEAQRDLGAK